MLSLVKAGTYEIKDYPSSVDLSDPNVSSYFPAVGNQRGIGSCCAWATVYYTFIYQNCRAKDVPATGDNIMSAAFPYTQRKANRDTGGVFDNQICDVLKTEGTPSRTICEFESFSSEHGVESWYPKKEIWMNAAEHRLEKFERLSDPGQVTSPYDSDLDEIKGYLNDGHLVNFITYMTGSKNMKIPAGSPHAGEMIRVATSNKGCHEMTIVGYDDDIFVDINGNGTIEEAEKGAFKVVNSWNEAYIHYSVSGKWTAAPGVKMEKSDKSGYRWMAVIDLYNSYDCDICFNDGNDNWDSMYGQNYHVLNGEYEIANGKVTRKR